jgi:hypothetical protein
MAKFAGAYFPHSDFVFWYIVVDISLYPGDLAVDELHDLRDYRSHKCHGACPADIPITVKGLFFQAPLVIS